MPSGGSNSAAAAGPSGHWTDRAGRHRYTHHARYATPEERRREQALTDWYGADQAPAEIAAHRSPARLVSELVDEALGRLGLADVAVLERVRSLWPTLVGADVARRALPVGVRDHVLTVEVNSSTWLYVLEREHRERVTVRLRTATGGEVAEVRFVPPGRLARQGP